MDKSSMAEGVLPASHSAASSKHIARPGLHCAGYHPRYPRLYAIWNVGIAAALIVVLLPLLVSIALALYLTQGPDILYRGVRLGRNRAPFHIYKFRTLERRIGTTAPEGLIGRPEFLTPLGHFLRATRLDELPQLFNVLKSDMNLMGPRPVRPETAARFAELLPGYDVRFRVAPGLVGYTQALMTHDTSKIIRQRFNLLLCRRPVSLPVELLFLARTGVAVITQIVIRLLQRLHRLLRGVRRDRRRHDRIRAQSGTVVVRKCDSNIGWGCLLDINDEAFTFVSAVPLEPGEFHFRLICQVERGRRRIATCNGRCAQVRRDIPCGRDWKGDYCYLVFFRPNSSASHYVLDRYFLRNCVVFRHGRMRLGRGFALMAALTLAANIEAAGAYAASEQSGRAAECEAAIAIRPYASDAPWNQLAKALPRHPNSEELAGLLWHDAPDRPGNFNLNFEDYTFAVYDASEASGIYPVVTLWAGNLKTAPWNPAWAAPPGADAQVIILDSRTGREWNMFQVAFDGTQIRATNANLVPGDYRTSRAGFPPSRGIGIPYLAMLVRPEEIRAGCIAHALSMPIRNPDGRSYVAPATKLEHPHGRSGIPQGTRFALDIGDRDIARWLDTLPETLSPQTQRAARIIAHALREYGWFITDTAGAAALQFESRASAGPRWDALGLKKETQMGKVYPRDLLDGLIRPERIYALSPPTTSWNE